jgi:hypothetical protein
MTFSEYFNSRHLNMRFYENRFELELVKDFFRREFETKKKEALSKRFVPIFSSLKTVYRKKIDKIISFDFLEAIEDTKKVQILTKQIQKIHSKYQDKNLSLYKN